MNPAAPSPATPATDAAGAPRPPTGGGPGFTVGPDPVLPAYGGACLASLVPTLFARREADVPPWLPSSLVGARQIVLLVLDGLGWTFLEASRAIAPTLAAGQGGPITSVAPTTTATALTSITTGATPAEHGIVGYRIQAPDAGHGERAEVMNVLRWSSDGGDLRRRYPARSLQPLPAFGGRPVPVVTRAEFASTGFSAAHLGGTRLVGWQLPSTLAVEVSHLLLEGEPFVYAYYDGLDKVAHRYGLGEHFERELEAADALVASLVDRLPPGAALVVTADHGQVQVDEPPRLPSAELLATARLTSGEGRFRWFHALPGAEDDLFAVAEALYGDEAWVRTRQQIEKENWLGGSLSPEVASRLGDVVVAARAPVAFLDPADTGETLLAARHGSLTAQEMLVPLVAWSA